MTARALNVIAADVSRHWAKPNPTAAPYLEAMATLTYITDNYFADTAQTIVLYFLANAAAWRGEDAKRIKTELKEILKGA